MWTNDAVFVGTVTLPTPEVEVFGRVWVSTVSLVFSVALWTVSKCLTCQV